MDAEKAVESTPPASPAPDLKATVAESMERLHQAPTPPKKKGVKPGSTRGPYGKTKNKKRHLEVADNSQPGQSAEIVEQTSVDLKLMLQRPLAMISKIPARRTGIPELALDDSEQVALAEGLEQIIQVYAPDLEKMSPKTAAILTFGVVSTSIFLNKMEMYWEHQNRKLKQPGFKIEAEKIGEDLNSHEDLNLNHVDSNLNPDIQAARNATKSMFAAASNRGF